jgi:hypothetical protein
MAKSTCTIIVRATEDGLLRGRDHELEASRRVRFPTSLLYACMQFFRARSCRLLEGCQVGYAIATGISCDITAVSCTGMECFCKKITTAGERSIVLVGALGRYVGICYV